MASTLVLSGRIVIKVEQTGAETAIARLGALLSATADYRTEIEHRSERIGDASVVPLLALSGLALATVGQEAATILLGCNFADNIRVAGPLGMLNFLHIAAKRSILIKDGRVLESLRQIDTVVFDKTGTLTLEQPVIGEIHVCEGFAVERLLGWAAAAEARQSHPIARAIVQRAGELGVPLPALEDVRYDVGYGVAAVIEGRWIQVGSARFLQRQGIKIPPEMEALQSRQHEQGSSLVFVAVDDSLAGGLELHPAVRTELAEVLRALRERGLNLCILSGDHEALTRRLANQLGIESYYAEVLPADKAAVVRSLQQQGRHVCFIGDGINDAIALKTADTSVSLRGAATVATDTAQVVLLGGNLQALPVLFSLSDEYERNARAGMVLSLGAGALCATGVFLLNIKLLTAMLLYNLSFIASIGNAMLPRLRAESEEPQRPSTDLAQAAIAPGERPVPPPPIRSAELGPPVGAC